MVDLSKANLISQAQKLKNYGAALKNATIKTRAQPVAAQQQTETKTVTTYTYTGYDSEGREINLTEDQYNQLVKAAESNTNKNQVYSVVPSEVVNESSGNWWINSNGQFEYIPATEAAKKQLAEINAYRTSSGLAARTTLLIGATPSAEYSEKWYSTGGGNRGVGEANVVKRSSSGEIVQTYESPKKEVIGSGSKKLEAMRNSSSMNPSSSAVSGTAQDAKASIITVGMQKEKEALEEESKIRNPLKKYASKEEYLKTLAEQKAAAQAAKEAAKKYNPIELSDGTDIFGIEVNSLSRESTAGAKGIISGEGYYSRNQAVAAYGMKKLAEKEAVKASALETVDTQNTKGETPTSNNLLGFLGLDYSKEQTAIKAAKDSGVTTAGIGLFEKANTAIASKLSFLPGSEAVRSSWDSFIEPKQGEYGSYGYGDLLEALGQKKAAESYRSVDASITEGVQDFGIEQYEGIKTKPVSKAAEYGAYYLGGEIFGAGTKGLKVVSAAAGKALVKPVTGLAEKTGSGLVAKGSRLAAKPSSKLVSSLESGKLVDTGLGAYLVYGSGKEIASSYSKSGLQGATKTGLDIGLALGIGAPGFKKGYDTTERVLAGDYIAAVPVLKSAKISEVKGGGSSIEPVDLKYGYTVAPFDKPLISYSKGDGLKIGSVGAPKAALSGKTTQAFSKLETEFFKETVNKNSASVESEYLESALDMNKKVSKTQKAPTSINELDITSKSIPESMRPAVKESLITYKGDLWVSGSVPMKAQTAPFTSRTPHDLEIYGDSETSIVSHISEVLESKGFKEGVDFKSSGSKMDFKIIDETGAEIYDTGIEAFTHGKETKELVKLSNGDTVLSPSPLKASAGKSEIAFGYNSRKPVEIEGGKIKIQSIQEQMSRKIAGSTMYKRGTLQPKHTGRIKDPLDVITMGTAFAVKDKVPIEKDIVTFTNAAFEKWGGKSKDPFSAAFKEKVAYDPLVKFIRENQRIPTEKESIGLNIKLPETAQPEIFSNRVNVERGSSPFRGSSPSPVTLGSPSPRPKSPSPRPKSSSPSTSPSPFRGSSPSPITLRSPSPRPKSPSPSPFESSSPSPVNLGSPRPKSPSPRPKSSSPSPSPFRDSSPSPVSLVDLNHKNNKRKVDLISSKEVQKPVSNVAFNGWGSRVKQHYVQDPFSLVLGGGKRRK